MDFRPITDVIDFSEIIPREILQTWTVYTLTDPITGQVRYVGVTHRKCRLSEHISAAKRSRTHKSNWISSLASHGLRPMMVIVERGAGDGWSAREKFWIAEYRSRGAPLTNHTLGGEGTSGWRHDEETRSALAQLARKVHMGRQRTPETKKRMSEARLRRVALLKEQGIEVRLPPKSAATLARMSAAQKGKTASPETRKRQSISAKLRATPERRALWADAARNRPTEWKTWFAQNQRGVPKSPEHRIKIGTALRGKLKRRSKPSADSY